MVRIYNNHEADVLCSVPLTLAESVQAIKDVLVHDGITVTSDREAFERARQSLIAKADAESDRDPALKGDSDTELFSELLRADDQIRDLTVSLIWIVAQPNCPVNIRSHAKRAIVRRYGH